MIPCIGGWYMSYHVAGMRRTTWLVHVVPRGWYMSYYPAGTCCTPRLIHVVQACMQAGGFSRVWWYVGNICVT
ncbi:MAG: hypothetical protein LBK07_09595 [Tannerella sp.]|nr:hypothetical protein [Tannerella sp.]